PALSHGRRLEPLQLRDRPLVPDLTRVDRGFRLEQQDKGFLIRSGTVLDAPRNDRELARSERNVTVAQLQLHASTDDEEQLVLVGMVVPDKGVLDLDGLDI